ncbi:hypothetical protein D3C81_805850 [compost metagenome]
MLARDHADRLWRLAQAQAHACCRSRFASGVGASAFGRGAQRLAGDAGRTQLQRRARLDPSGEYVIVAGQHHLQLATRQQLREPLFDAEAPLQAWRLPPLGERRIE